MYLKRNDLVVVLSGNNKGKQGRVLRVDHEAARVWVQGVNLVKKHIRRSQKQPRGGRIEIEAPIDVSNVLLVDPRTNQPTRVGFRFENGKKIRYAKKSGEPV
ncbi:MAG: 50S ribosomal protein L24 [Planctomycetes bacterium]|nr:50S ribosomal protein L24 [Planctomycetota bacterium]